MENVVKIPNAGVLPRETDPEELDLIHTIETDTPVADPEADIPRDHVRSPELRRNGTKLTMTAAALIGAAAGARLLFGEFAPGTLVNGISGTFGEIFLRQTLHSALFLAAEFILGFFAFGDLAVWVVPFLYGAGTALRAASSLKLLPGAFVCLIGVILGAAYSADMSGLLLKLTRGGTVYMDTRPRLSYALGFAGCLAAAALGAMITGIISVYS